MLGLESSSARKSLVLKEVFTLDKVGIESPGSFPTLASPGLTEVQDQGLNLLIDPNHPMLGTGGQPVDDAVGTVEYKWAVRCIKCKLHFFFMVLFQGGLGSIDSCPGCDDQISNQCVQFKRIGRRYVCTKYLIPHQGDILTPIKDLEIIHL